MNKSKIFLIVIISAAIIVTGYFFYGPQEQRAQEINYNIQISANQYSEISGGISASMSDIALSPPVGERWTLEEIAFAHGANQAYVTYHDSNNIFRILLEIGNGQDGRWAYRILSSFELHETGWNITDGQDAAAGKKLINFIYDPESKAWVERKDQNGTGESD